MVKSIFFIVANSLLSIGRKTGLTYNEVNILVYYLLIPLSWTIMLDCWLGVPVATGALLSRWLNTEVYNMGFSSSGKAEDEVAEQLAVLMRTC